jgi:hypothetical protein
MCHNLTSVAWGGEFAWWVLDEGAYVRLSLALINNSNQVPRGGGMSSRLW